jgi:hypothetical protein
MYGGRERTQYTVDFSGTSRHFRRELSPIVGLYSATAVDPEVDQVIVLGLISAKLNLLVARLRSSFGYATCKILINNFLISWLLSVRQDGVRGDLVFRKPSQAETAVGRWL